MEMNIKLIEESTQQDVIRGYSEDDKGFKCLLCGEYFTKGEIYELNGRLYDANKMVQLHIEEIHESVLGSLLKLSSNDVGISDLQLGLLSLFAGGLSDKQISEHLGVASSTIRNHRYKLREKEKQAKIFLVIMELLEEKQGKIGKNIKSKVIKDDKVLSGSYAKVNKKNYEEVLTGTSTDVDVDSVISSISDNKIDTTSISEKSYTTNIQPITNKFTKDSSRNKVEEDLEVSKEDSSKEEYLYVENVDVAISEKDKKTILAMHVNEFGRVKTYPTTLKAQRIVLEYVIKNFERGKKYIDAEVNVILMGVYVDYKVLKKELIEQGFLSRSEKGGIYWVKGA